MSDSIIKSFTTILNFVKELNDCFGYKHKNIHSYYKLMKKTQIGNKVIMEKHASIFKEYCDNNSEFINKKDVSLIKNDNISFSDKVYLNIKELIIESDQETKNVIFKHLQVIYYLLNPNNDTKLALTSKSNGKNETNFIKSFMTKIEDEFKSNQFDDPLTATMTLLQNGIFTDMMNSMTKELSSGNLDVSNLLGSVQGMMTEIKGELDPEEASKIPDINDMMNKFQNINPENPQDIQNMVGNMMGGLKLDGKGVDIMNLASNIMGGEGNILSAAGGMLGGIMGGSDKSDELKIEDIEDIDNKKFSKDELLKLMKEEN